MRLIKLDSGRFQIVDGASVIEGNWPTIRAQLMFEFEVDADQIDEAIEDMRITGNDIADFGIYQTFVFSYASSLDRKVKAELRAIQSVREEFHTAQAKEKNGPEAKQAFDRLMHLYFTQDVDGNLMLLGEVNYADLAA